MMISEFIERTGFEPTAAEYEKIEDAYYNFDGNKDEFCKAWKKNGGIEQTCRDRAKKIEQLQSQIGELEKDLMKQIKNLEAQLEREQEWRPHTDEHNYKQTDYDRLAGCGRIMTDAEAIRWVSDVFGFREDKIKVYHEIDEFEINRHRQLRRTGKKLDRRPLYDATDWNYVRFDVGGWMYECVNGELHHFCA